MLDKFHVIYHPYRVDFIDVNVDGHCSYHFNWYNVENEWRIMAAFVNRSI